MPLIRRVLPSFCVALAFLALWQAYCVLAEVSPLILPAPSDVARGLWRERAGLAGHAAATLGVAALGFSMSVGFAFSASVALHFVPGLRAGLLPLLVASQTVPIVALAPLMVLWFGFGLLPKILLVVLVTFFPMLVSLLAGYARLPAAYRDQLVSMGAGSWQVFRRAALPVARPHFFNGLRITATYAIVATIFAEYAGARRGLGIYILTAKNNFRADLVLSAVVLSALLTLLLLGAVQLVERATGRRFGRGDDAAD